MLWTEPSQNTIWNVDGWALPNRRGSLPEVSRSGPSCAGWETVCEMDELGFQATRSLSHSNPVYIDWLSPAVKPGAFWSVNPSYAATGSHFSPTMYVLDVPSVICAVFKVLR